MDNLTKEVTATCGSTILVVGLSNKDEVMYVKSTIRWLLGEWMGRI